MKKGWYILLYHNVSWEESPFLRGIGGTIPPDYFSEHMKYLAAAGDIVSVSEGIDRVLKGDVRGPLFSIWFDDGFVSNRKYAMPVLDRYGAVAAISVCSRFIEKSEFFWRSKLSYLSYIDGLRFLRTRLRRYGYKTNMSVKDFYKSHFSESIVQEIDAVYRNFTSEEERQDAFRLFDTEKGLRELLENKWTLSNHTAAHYPVGEDSFADHFEAQFREGEDYLHNFTGMGPHYWVLPFGNMGTKAAGIVNEFKHRDDGNYIVLVENRVNRRDNIENKIVYRITIPVCEGCNLLKYLGRFSR